MALLSEVYFKKETLEILLKGIIAKDLKGIGITVAINDNIDNYGNNIIAHVKQSKEEREAKKPKFYVANGKVVWKNDTPIVVVPYQQNGTVSQPTSVAQGLPIPQVPAPAAVVDNLPF